MGKAIEATDIKLRYVSIAEARTMPGLRLVLGAYAIPGPWREACKSLFHVKRIPYTPVVTADAGQSDLAIGINDSQRELIAWTGQASAPVAVWNDERPRASWIDQINLAERLQPEPRLVPGDVDERCRMFGLINELAGENGLGWSKRLLMAHGPLSTLAPDDPGRKFWAFLGGKYGYTPALAQAAPARMIAILGAFATQLAASRSRGSRYLVGGTLTAADIYWATFCGLLAPMPPERCPMADAFRGPYGLAEPEIRKALTPELLAHRDFIYDTHLELPVVF